MNKQQQKHVDIIPMSIIQPTIEQIQDIIENRYKNDSTRKRYFKIVTEFLGMGFDFTPDDVRAYRNSLTNTPRTINGKLSIIKAVSGILYDEGMITGDCKLKISRIKRLRDKRDVKVNWLTTGEVVKTISSTMTNVSGWRDKSLLSMMFATGLRRAEIRSLSWNHLHWKDDTLTIEKLRTKGGAIRNFVIQNFAIDPLLTWADEVVRQFELEIEDGLPVADFPVYLSVKQNEEIDPKRLGISDSGVTQIVERCGELAGLPLRPHDCRRTYASLLYTAGIDMKTIQYMLGHSTLLTTEKYLNPIITQQRINDTMITL